MFNKFGREESVVNSAADINNVQSRLSDTVRDVEDEYSLPDQSKMRAFLND